MSDKRVKIKWLVGGLTVYGVGITEPNKEVEVDEETAASLVHQKLAKYSKINNNNKKPDKGEDIE